MRSQSHSGQGFTLIEILIVVVIIGILAAMVIPKFSDARQDASVSSVRNQLQTLRAQLEVYRMQQKGAIPDAASLPTALVEAGLIRQVPEWPVGFSIDEAHYGSSGLIRLSYDPAIGDVPIDQAEVAGW